jgi:hypothetical protein
VKKLASVVLLAIFVSVLLGLPPLPSFQKVKSDICGCQNQEGILQERTKIPILQAAVCGSIGEGSASLAASKDFTLEPLLEFETSEKPSHLSFQTILKPFSLSLEGIEQPPRLPLRSL